MVINNSYKENFDNYLIDKNGEKTLLGTVKNPFIDFIFEINFLTITDNKIKYVKKLKNEVYELETKNTYYKFTLFTDLIKKGTLLNITEINDETIDKIRYKAILVKDIVLSKNLNNVFNFKRDNIFFINPTIYKLDLIGNIYKITTFKKTYFFEIIQTKEKAEN